MAQQYIYAGTAVTVMVAFVVPAGPVVPDIQWSNGSFVVTNGSLTDPTSISITFLPAGATESTTWTYPTNISRIDVGVYQATLNTTGAPGVWQGEWIGTGDCATAWPFNFNVEQLPV